MELKTVSRMRPVISIKEVSGPFPSKRTKWLSFLSFRSSFKSFSCIRIGIFEAVNERHEDNEEDIKLRLCSCDVEFC